jgi:alkylhydroperoxidase/carboxymuconolactone decarboxylase family protein YurZ
MDAPIEHALIGQIEPAFHPKLCALGDVTRRRGALTDIEHALIGVAVFGNPTSFSRDSLRWWSAQAMAVGASQAQVLDALKLASVLGIHSLSVGVPAVAEVLRERNLYGPDTELDAHRRALKSEFEKRRGYWHESWDDLLRLDPEMFETYLSYSAYVADQGSIEPELRELIYIAIDAVATHLYVPGIQLHARNAIDLGVPVDKILSALEVASLLMPTTYSVAAGVVTELAEERASE